MKQKKTFGKYLFLCVLAVGWLTLFSGCSAAEAEGEQAREETDGTTETTIVRKPAKPAQEAGETETGEKDDVLYIVQELRTDEEKIVLTSTDTGRNYLYPYSLSTRFLDKYGMSTSSLNFTVGSVVTIGDKLPSQVLSSVQKAVDVWEYTDISNYSIDADLGMLTVGNEKYRITGSTVVYSGGVVGSLTDIGTDDVLQVTGKDKKVLTISVTTGHGYLALANTAKFEGSLLCIGNKIFTMVTPDMTVTVPEGTYFVTAANEGYGGTTLVEIKRNETTLLDMAQLEGEGPKVCKLTLHSTVEGAEIYMDGSRLNDGEETEVQYGRHTLMVAAEGYDTWKRTLFVNSETANITIDPTEGEAEKASDNSESTENNDEASASSESSSRSENAAAANQAAQQIINNTTGSTANTSGNTTGNTSNTTSNTNTNTTANSGSSTSNSSDTKSAADAEIDYLSTLSSMISALGGTGD